MSHDFQWFDWQLWSSFPFVMQYRRSPQWRQRQDRRSRQRNKTERVKRIEKRKWAEGIGMIILTHLLFKHPVIRSGIYPFGSSHWTPWHALRSSCLDQLLAFVGWKWNGPGRLPDKRRWGGQTFSLWNFNLGLYYSSHPFLDSNHDRW